MEVRDYVIRRGILLIPSMLFVALVTFILTRTSTSAVGLYASRFTGPEQLKAIEEAYGLNEPLYVQFVYWLRGAIMGDLGWSQEAGAPVAQAIVTKAPASFELAFFALIFAILLSVTLGTLAGKYPDTWIDHVSRGIAVGGMSTPQFWAGIVLLYLGYVQFDLFPTGRSTSVIWNSIPHPTGLYTVDALLALNATALFDALHHLILPAIVIGYAESAVITRHLRSEIIEKSREEYVNAARARGLVESVVYNKHIRRNALIPTITVAGLSFAFLLRGVIVVELVFSWPGLGRWVADSAVSGDYPAVMGFILVIAAVVLLLNLLVDVLYAYLDPRVTYEGED
jgi:peptide/nickel transport system permease protein